MEHSYCRGVSRGHLSSLRILPPTGSSSQPGCPLFPIRFSLSGVCSQHLGIAGHTTEGGSTGNGVNLPTLGTAFSGHVHAGKPRKLVSRHEKVRRAGQGRSQSPEDILPLKLAPLRSDCFPIFNFPKLLLQPHFKIEYYYLPLLFFFFFHQMHLKSVSLPDNQKYLN